MSEQPGAETPASIPVDQLTEAVASGVLRALNSPTFARDKAVDVGQLAADRGIFGQIVIVCGIWPTGKEPPVGGIGLPIGGVGGAGEPGASR
jgi:hypothetical protein